MSAAPESAPASSGVRAAVGTGLALWLVVALLTGLALQRERGQALQRAQEEAATLSAALEENTARTFDGVDVALEGLAAWLGREDLPRHDPTVRALMQSQLRYLPTVRALFVIRPDGFIQHDTDYPKTPDVSLADRDYFRQYLLNPGLRSLLSPALKSRSGTGWFVASTRRIVGRDGSFRGIVVAAVQLDSVSSLYRKLDLAAGQTMALLQSDGRLIARYPHDDAMIGQNYGDSPLFAQRLPRQPAGVYLTSGPPLAYPRIVSYRRLESQPLVVVLSTSESVALAGWRRTATGAGVALGIFAAVIALGVLLFVQRQQQKARALAHHAAETEARAQAEANSRVAEELGRADQRKGEFLATLSHELRNVLAPMQNGMTILERVDPQSQQAARARAMVQRQLGQMRHLVDDLLDVSRVNSGKIQLRKEHVDLRTLVEMAVESAQAVMEAPGHHLEAAPGDEALPVEVDRARMLQVLANLLGNAAKYTPPGGHIRIAARREDSHGVVEVTDNGMGIPPAALARVFDMFEQVDDHLGRSEGGLGIGLALVQKLVALHGGRVEARSDGVDQGSTFRVVLPLSPP